MKNQTELKNYIILDNTNKYNEINQKIIKESKIYFRIMKNHSFQITQIENKLNEYNIKNNVSIKLLLQNQQNIIKDLIIIINKLLSDKVKNKIEKNSIKQDNNNNSNNPLFNKSIKNIKNIFNEKSRNKTSRNNQKNNINKSVNNNVFNVKYLNKKICRKKFINKKLIKKEIELSNKKLFKSLSTFEIYNSPNLINNTLYLKNNSFTNTYRYYFKNHNYTLDEERSRNNNSLNNFNKRHTNKIHNIGSLPNLLGKFNRNKKNTYRPMKTNNSKEEYYLINNYTFTNFNIANSSSFRAMSTSCKRKNNCLIFTDINVNKINNNNIKNNIKHKKLNRKIYATPYMNNGIRIIPNRYTKEILNSSKKIVNNYKIFLKRNNCY